MAKTKMVNGAQVTEIPVGSKTNEQLERESHEYSVAKIKTFRGMDGEGLNAVLKRGKTVVAEIVDEGSGGEMRFYWTDGHHDTAEEAMFNAFLEQKKMEIPADLMDKELNCPARELFSDACWIWAQVDKIENDRRMRRSCKKNTLFQVGAAIGGPEFRVVTGVTPEIRARIEQKYAGQKIRILNDEYKD